MPMALPITPPLHGTLLPTCGSMRKLTKDSAREGEPPWAAADLDRRYDLSHSGVDDGDVVRQAVGRVHEIAVRRDEDAPRSLTDRYRRDELARSSVDDRHRARSSVRRVDSLAVRRHDDAHRLRI